MDKQILSALTAFISNEMKEGRLTGPLFDNLTDGQIEGIWKEFDQLAMANHGNYTAIYNDFDKYNQTGHLDFSQDKTIEIGLLEGFLKCLLLQIDDQTYTLDKKGFLRKGRIGLKFEELIDEIRNRSKHHKHANIAKSMVETCGKLDDARRLRNNCKGHMAGRNGELLKAYITAFFVSTIIYRNIKDILAGFQVTVYHANASMQIRCGNDSIFTQNNLPYGRPICIPVARKLFGNETTITITMQIEVPFKGNKTKDINVKRGVFQNNPIAMKLPANPPKPETVPPVVPKPKPVPEQQKQLFAYGIRIQGEQIANMIKVGDPLETSGERIRTIPQLKANQPINIWIYKHSQPGDMTPLACLSDSEKEPVLKKTISYAEAVNNETVKLKCISEKNGKVRLEVTWGEGYEMSELL